MFSIAVVVAGLVGYAIRGVFSYFHTKDKYLLNMTRSLYFQKLDSNAGVIYRLLQEARQQDLMEVIIGYYALHRRQDPVTRSELRRDCEALLRELLDIDIRFDVDVAINKLTKLEVAIEGGGNTWTVLSPQSALVALDRYWDSLVLDSSKESK